MRLMHLAIIVSVIGLFSGCGTPGGTKVSAVENQTADDLAACGGGISSSTEVQTELKLLLTKQGGDISLVARDDLKTAFSKAVSESNLVAYTTLFTSCMEKRRSDRAGTDAKAAVAACQSAWTCDLNVVAGFCSCRKTVSAIGLEKGWTELQTAVQTKASCGFDFKTCWPRGELNAERARCEVVLANANIKIPIFSSATCSVSGG